MILTLFQINYTSDNKDIQMQSYKFALDFDGFEDTYTVKFDEASKMGNYHTHFPIHVWEGSELGDIPIKLKLAVGAIEGVVTAIDSSEKLLSILSDIYSWSLPLNISDKKVTVVNMSVGDGYSTWYKRQGFLTSIKTKFMGPWDTRGDIIGEFNDGKGRPMQAEVNLVLRPFFAADSDSSDITDKGIVFDSRLPHRPWRFDVPTGW